MNPPYAYIYKIDRLSLGCLSLFPMKSRLQHSTNSLTYISDNDLNKSEQNLWFMILIELLKNDCTGILTGLNWCFVLC